MNSIEKFSSGKSRGGRTVTVLLVIGIFAGLVWHTFAGRSIRPAKPPLAPLAVPVQSALVTRADIPLFLEGLGTVQAFNTVTISSRVDGELQDILFKEGQVVKRGDLLARIDPRPYQAALDLAFAAKDKDQAQLENVRRDLDRYLLLAPKDLASKQMVDTQRALVAQMEAQLKADQANIDNARTQLDYTTLRSPICGRTGIRLMDVGNILHGANSAGIVVVTQMQPIAAIFTLPEDVLPMINQAIAQGSVEVIALSRDNATTLDKGTLALVDNQIDQTTGTIRLKATFPNANSALWPGEFINTRLLLQVQHQVLTIPATAVQRGPNGIFAYVVKQDSTVEARPITGTEKGDTMVVNGGLRESERVVTSNQYRLQPGTPVQTDVHGAPPPPGGGLSQ